MGFYIPALKKGRKCGNGIFLRICMVIRHRLLRGHLDTTLREVYWMLGMT
jgi:hypothetical protein